MMLLLLLCLFSLKVLAEQSLGYSYELDSPHEGVKFRGFGSPPIMRNMLMPIVRNTLWVLRSFKHFETFTFQHSLSLTYPKVIEHFQDGQHVSGNLSNICANMKWLVTYSEFEKKNDEDVKPERRYKKSAKKSNTQNLYSNKDNWNKRWNWGFCDERCKILDVYFQLRKRGKGLSKMFCRL